MSPTHDDDAPGLLELIRAQQFELHRLREQSRESDARAREDRAAVKAGEKRLAQLLEETIADRPLLDYRAPAESIPVAAAPNWSDAEIHTLELEDDTIRELQAQGVQTVPQLIAAAADNLPGLDRDQAVDVNNALRAFRFQLGPGDRIEFDVAASEARGAVFSEIAAAENAFRMDDATAAPGGAPEPPVTNDDPFTLKRCPDCGGDADKPNRGRKPHSLVACHISGAKARPMSVTPESVRQKRENPPEIQPVAVDWHELPITTPGWLPKDTARRLARDGIKTFGKLRDKLALIRQDGTRESKDSWELAYGKDCLDEFRDIVDSVRAKRERPPEIQPVAGEPNEFGVFTSPEMIEIPMPRGAKCRAGIRLALAPDGLWRVSADHEMPLAKGGQGGYLPNVKHRGYREKREAILAECEQLLERFHRNGYTKAVDAVKDFGASWGDGFLDWKPPVAVDPEPLVDDWQSVGVHDLELSDALANAHEQLGNLDAGDLAEWLEQIERDEDDGSTVAERFSWVYRESAVASVRQALEGIRQGGPAPIVRDLEQVLAAESDADAAFDDPEPVTDWQTVPVADLGLPTATAELVQAVGMTTAGGLANWLSQMESLSDVVLEATWGIQPTDRATIANDVRNVLTELRPDDDPQPAPKPKRQTRKRTPAEVNRG